MHGVGPKTAKEWYDRGIRSVEEAQRTLLRDEDGDDDGECCCCCCCCATASTAASWVIFFAVVGAAALLLLLCCIPERVLKTMSLFFVRPAFVCLMFFCFASLEPLVVPTLCPFPSGDDQPRLKAEVVMGLKHFQDMQVRQAGRGKRDL